MKYFRSTLGPAKTRKYLILHDLSQIFTHMSLLSSQQVYIILQTINSTCTKSKTENNQHHKENDGTYITLLKANVSKQQLTFEALFFPVKKRNRDLNQSAGFGCKSMWN